MIDLILIVSLLDIRSERWAALLKPPQELLQDLDFFSQMELVDQLEVVEAGDPEAADGVDAEEEKKEQDQEIREWRRSIKRSR